MHLTLFFKPLLRKRSRGYVSTNDAAVAESWRLNVTDSRAALTNLSAVLITLAVEL